jgi:hypothetical protein
MPNAAYASELWKVSKGAQGYSVLGQIGGEWITIADQLDEDDAYLIAAAPELLRELVRAHAETPDANKCGGCSMSATIKKARGETK